MATTVLDQSPAGCLHWKVCSCRKRGGEENRQGHGRAKALQTSLCRIQGMMWGEGGSAHHRGLDLQLGSVPAMEAKNDPD